MRKFICVAAVFCMVLPVWVHGFVYLEKFPSECFAGGTFEDALLANLYNCVPDPGGNAVYKDFLDKAVNEDVKAVQLCNVAAKAKLLELMKKAGGDPSILSVELGNTLFKNDTFKITVATYTVAALPDVGGKAEFKRADNPPPQSHYIVICNSNKPDALHDLVKASLDLTKVAKQNGGLSFKRIVEPKPEMIVVYVNKSQGGKITQVVVPLDIGEMMYSYEKTIGSVNKYLYQLVGVVTDEPKEAKGANHYGFYLKNLRGYSGNAQSVDDLLWFKSDGDDLGGLFKQGNRTNAERDKDAQERKFFAQNGIFFFFLRSDKLVERFEALKAERVEWRNREEKRKEDLKARLLREQKEAEERRALDELFNRLANALYHLAQQDGKKK